MPNTRIIGHDERVRSKVRIFLVSLCRLYIRNHDLEILVYHAFASRNRLLQSGEVAQLVSSIVGWKAEVVIHIDRISMTQPLYIASLSASVKSLEPYRASGMQIPTYTQMAAFRQRASP